MHLTVDKLPYTQVCNHPDLFEGRPIVSSFDMWGLPFHLPSLALHALSPSKWDAINLSCINADVLSQEGDCVWAAQQRQVWSHTAHDKPVPALLVNILLVQLPLALLGQIPHGKHSCAGYCNE